MTVEPDVAGNRIGSQLIAAGRLDEAALQAALDHQQEVGGYLGQHLLESGSINRADLLEALARQWDVTTRDLDREPPEPRLAAIVDVAETIELGWVACELTENGVVIVATSVRPGPDLLEEVQELFPGMPVEFVACTQRDLDHVAVRARSAQTPALARDRLTDRPRSAAASVAVGVILAAGSVALTVLAPLAVLATVLAVAGPLFLVAVLVQCRAAIALAVREVAVEREAAEFRRAVGESGAPIQHDALLPAYSVLVPVSGPRETVERIVRRLEGIDYPSSRLDAILLVADDDDRTLAAVREVAPPAWVRVLSVPPHRFREPALACDDGLAMARGRYVVAYASDEVPDPDQLRRAVDLFEADLIENLERQPHRAPLAGLRTRHRVWGRDGSVATGGEVVETALALDRAYPWRGEFTELARDLLSTHFNSHVLRRAGGWQAYLDGVGSSPNEHAALRMATLQSTSRRIDVPGLWSSVRRRADRSAIAARIAGARARVWLLNLDFGGHRVTLRQVLLGFSAPLLFLGYPVLIAAATSYGIRWSVARDDTLATGGVGVSSLVLAVAVAVIVAAVLAAWRQGLPAAGHMVLLPVHWLVRGAAAWYAVLVLPHRRRPS
ncbi:MAG: glycosyltransferase [Propionibacteriales bacterium]|nr:glycosyltransferase [Propionibacteriales bacterium]